MVQSQSIYCDNAYQCVGNPITTNGVNDVIYARGYRAISGNTSSIDNTADVRCSAAFGCYASSFIKAGGDIFCHGSNSCFGSVINSTGSNWTFCDGSNSCQSSIVTTTGDRIYCNGDSSCSYSSIIIRNTTKKNIGIHGWASHSLMASNIETPDYNATITINLRGYNSGYGLNITCKPSDICNINRFNNAGKPIDIKCNGNCNIINLSDSTAFNESLFDGFNETLFGDIYDSKALTTNNDNICNQHPNASLADNYREYYGTNNIMNEGAICCRGDESCKDVNNMEVDSTNQDAIICSGYHGCSQIGSMQNKNGPIFCSGYQSCYDSNISTTDTVYCLGRRGCQLSNIYNATNIFCTARWSCKNSTIISAVGGTKIYLMGYNAGLNMAVHCNNNYCSIFCKGFKACQGLTVYNNSYHTASSTTDPSVSPIYFATSSPTAHPIDSTSVSSYNRSQSISASTSHPTSFPSESAIHFTTAAPNTSNSYILIIICIILGLILIVCILIYLKLHRNKKRFLNHNVVDPQGAESKNIDVEITENNSKLSSLPKMYTLTPPGLAGQDSLNTLNIEGDIERDIELEKKESAMNENLYENVEENEKSTYTTPNTLGTKGERVENYNTPKITKQQTGDV